MENEDKKDYEIGFLLRNEGDAQEIIKLLKQHEAEITFEGPLKKIALAYKIEHTLEAYFGYLHFKLSPEKVSDLDRDLKNKPAILRFLIITPPFVKMRAQTGLRPRDAQPVQPQPATVATSASPLSNEALEKKIEEILQ